MAQMVKNLPTFPGKGNSYPLQYFCLENSKDREAWWATVHAVAMGYLICFPRENILGARCMGTLSCPQPQWASLVTQMVKNLLDMQESWIRSLGLNTKPRIKKGLVKSKDIYSRIKFQQKAWGLIFALKGKSRSSCSKRQTFRMAPACF